MKPTVLLPTAMNVVAGQRATIVLPIGPVYHRVLFDLSGSTVLLLSHLTNIKLIVNGTIVQEYKDGLQLKAFNSYYNRAGTPEADSDFLTLHIGCPEMENEQQRDALGLGTAGLSSVTIEMDIAAGATAPALAVSAEIERDLRKAGVIPHIRQFTRTFGAGGIQEFDTLPKGPGMGFLGALHCKTANTTSAKLEANQQTVLEGTRSTFARMVGDGTPSMRRTAQAGYLHMDMAREGAAQWSLPTEGLTDLRAKLNLSAGETVQFTAIYFKDLAA